MLVRRSTIHSTNSEHSGTIRFSVIRWTLVWNMYLLTMWPWPLTFLPQIHVASSTYQGHSLHQVWTILDHSLLSYAADKQTDLKTLRTPTDIVGMGNELPTCENEMTTLTRRVTWSLSSWLLWVSDRCLNSCIIRMQCFTFSGETKSSATLMQLWRFLTCQSHAGKM